MVLKITSTPASKKQPYACPLRAKNLKGLPPALVVTASHDPLRDEGERFAERLIAAGINVTCTRYEGVTHAFVSFADALDKGKRGPATSRRRLEGGPSRASHCPCLPRAFCPNSLCLCKVFVRGTWRALDFCDTSE